MDGKPLDIYKGEREINVSRRKNESLADVLIMMPWRASQKVQQFTPLLSR
jgi:hypothetical protein